MSTARTEDRDAKRSAALCQFLSGQFCSFQVLFFILIFFPGKSHFFLVSVGISPRLEVQYVYHDSDGSPVNSVS